MLKVVVFDSGYGGESFADYLQENLPIIEIIRVIDWRNSEAIISKAKLARQIAEEALRPYIGRVDLVIFANHLLTITSLRYFRRKYNEQKFLGMGLKFPEKSSGQGTTVLTTRAVAKTINYHNFLYRLKGKTKTITPDDWVIKIDDGELTQSEISDVFLNAGISREQNSDIVLACSQFNDIKPELINYFNGNIKIYDSFEDTLRQACKKLNIRGGIGRKKS